MSTLRSTVEAACPECDSRTIYRTVRVEESESIVDIDEHGDILETKSLDIHWSEQIGPFECENGHTFADFVIAEQSS